MKRFSRFAALFVLLASFTTPLLAAAATAVPTGINLSVVTPYSSGIINFINGILVPILMAVAFIVFLYGIFQYFILGAADEKSRTTGREFALWGIIGFVVILTVWGLVALVSSTFGLTLGGAAPTPPTI